MPGTELKSLLDVVPAPVVEKSVNAPELIAARALLAMAATENVPSPCVSVCHMDEATGLCLGCCRTLEEIGQWSRLDDPAKRNIWRHIEQRLAASQA